MVAQTQNGHRSHQHSAFPRTYPQNSNYAEVNQDRKPTSSSWWPSALIDGLVNPPETHHPPSPANRHKRPNYPTTIEFTPSHEEDDDQPFDEEEYSLLGLNRHHNHQMQVQGESFGFDTSNPDEEFNRLYAEEEEDEEQTQTTFMGLNPYHSNTASNELDNAIFAQRQQSNQQQRATGNYQQHRSHDINRSSSHMPTRQQPPQQQPVLKSALRNKPSGDASLLSPATAMERRRSQKHPAATTSITRSRSHSRSHRSSSRDIRRTSSRSSRSTSRGPPKSDNYHSSVFRGAELIKEQLLRSMASADHAMDEANKEFMADTNDDVVYRREQKLARMVKETRQSKNSGDEDIDFDYSGKYQPEQPVPITPSLSRIGCGNNSVRFAVNEAHEEESQRLDELARIFMSSSSASTSKSGGDKSKTSSKSLSTESRAAATVAKTEDGWQQQEVQMMMGTRVVSPTESAGPSNNTTPPSSTGVTHRCTEDTQPTSNVINSVRLVPEKISPRNLDQDRFQRVNRVKDEPEDEAVAHARRAGPLWRALVGNHVRFPSKWETILGSSKPLIPSHLEWSKWYYIARHRVKGDKRLNSRELGIRSRRSGGRILLRLVVKEMHSQNICREIVVGCFHPNSKGIRRGDPKPENEDVREVYMAVRWTMYEADEEPRLDLGQEHDNYEGVVDNFLMQRRTYLDYSTMGSPLGHRKAVKNENVKAIFGDQAPTASVELHEDEFAEILKSNGVENVAVMPALVLLKLFLFSR